MGLKDIFAALKKHHKNALVDLEKECEVECWSTSHFLIDRVLGKGFPKGRIIELWGPEGSGKSTIALQIGKAVQKAGQGVLYVDYEHAFDKNYALQLGLSMNKLIVVQPDYGEEGFEIIRDTLDLGGVGLVIIDSVAAIVPKKEIEGEMGHHQMGLQSMIVTQLVKQLCARISKANVCVVGINQVRSTVTSWGSGETTPGGRAFKFYASIRVKMSKKSGIKKEIVDNMVTASLMGQRVKFMTVKNKVAAPFRECEVDLIFGKGFQESSSLVELGLEKGLIVKSGAYFKFKEENYRGLEAVKEVVSRDEFRQEILNYVRTSERQRLPNSEVS